MAARFLVKTVLAPGQVLRTPDGPVLDAYTRLRTALAQSLGPAAAELLAEPVVTWGAGGGTEAGEGSVSWYSELVGTAMPLPQVPPERRALLDERLRFMLARVAPLLADPSLGPVWQRALCVRSADSLWAVGDQVVLTEWGSVPAGSEGAGSPADMLGRSVLGAYLPAAGGAMAPPIPPAIPPAMPPPASPARPRSAVPPLPPPRPSGPARASASWLVVPAALAVAALFLALGYWRGSLLANERAAARNNTVSVLDDAAARRSLEQQNQLNAALEKQIEERRRLLQGNVCVADPATLPRRGPDQAALPPPAVVPPPPGGQPFQGTLADLLKQAIVMVLAPGENNSLSVGTGFFVTPELIATNRHVIEASTEGKVLVLNNKLGHPVRGQVVAATPNSDIGSLDVALIRVPAQGGVQPLSFTNTAAELDPVIAAGYPALITRSDAAMQNLLQSGDLSAAPQLVLTDGRIQAIQTSPAGVKIMPHGASISGGNSGGPLVDGCGRVVGINTFVRADAESAAHANYAEKSDSIVPFLKQNGAAITDLAGPCTPGAPAAPAPAAPAAPAPAH